MAELEVKIDRRLVTPDSTRYKAGQYLEARVSGEAFSRYGGFFVVRTPLADYVPDHEAIRARDGEVVDLGNIPTLACSSVQRAEFPLEDDTLYDLLYLHRGTQLDPVRLTTGTGVMPDRLTFDEIKLMAALRPGFRPEELSGISATVIYDGIHLRNSREYLYYGLQVGDVVANISAQHPLGMHYALRRGNIAEDFLEIATSETLAKELRKLKGL